MSRVKSGKTLAKARFDIDRQIVRYTSVVERKTSRSISQVDPSAVSPWTPMCCSRLVLKLEMCKILSFAGDNTTWTVSRQAEK